MNQGIGTSGPGEARLTSRLCPDFESLFRGKRKGIGTT